MSAAKSRECLVDTDVWIDYLQGHPLAIEFVKKLPERTWISAVSVAELNAGVREGAEREALALLISSLEVADLTAEIATRRWFAAAKFPDSVRGNQRIIGPAETRLWERRRGGSSV
ncbi:MAG: type II toxin-antitoxin system VapC family toxin [Brachymonas sp.]|nr:type II toxin-antitoxin system VapC family toxin [Brachymonas sp.]